MAEASEKGAAVMKRVALMGDCMLGRLVDEAMTSVRTQRVGQASALRRPSWLSAIEIGGSTSSPAAPTPGAPAWQGLDFVWGDLLPLLLSADLRLINLETSITRNPHKWPGQAFNFRMDPDNIDVLKAARVDFCSLANNHILDYRLEGMHDTMKVLRAAGVKYAGCGNNRQEAMAPAHLQLDGTRMVCFSAADHFDYWAATESSPGINFLNPYEYSPRDLKRFSDAVSDARAVYPGQRVLAVICLHWGPNYSWRPSNAIRGLAKELVDFCGFDLVVGTSAHHIQGIEVYKGTPILYGLGDFLDDYIVDDEYRNDLGFVYILHWDPAAAAFTHVDLFPSHIDRLHVTSVRGTEAKRWLFETMERLCAGTGTRCKVIDGVCLRVPLSPS